jgi:hypothetical protein
VRVLYLTSLRGSFLADGEGTVLSVNLVISRLSNVGHAFWVVGSQIFQEVWVADFASFRGGKARKDVHLVVVLACRERS